ncbi:MAG: glycine cleavage system aminomethyltransferase GcvT [Pseudomonadota bacterium]
MQADLKTTSLNDTHIKLGAKMVPFAGYNMPVQYPMGVMQEHLWTRERAGLFDVSHMGQCFLIPDDGKHETAARALEMLVPADILNMKPHQQRYTQFLNKDGGILDDLMVTRTAYEGHDGWLYLVVNAGCKDADYAHLEKNLPPNVKLKVSEQLALIALQGPKAASVLSKLVPQVSSMPFMTYYATKIADMMVHISRSGYTGEDGFEISVHDKDVVKLWNMLLENPDVKPIGLGARDSLRLEAGLCLYGHDIDETTSPVEAGLVWSMQKRRRIEGGFPGAARIQKELKDGASRVRVGIQPEGRAPAREGTEIVDPATNKVIGKVTSGGFGPSINGPVAMGYVEKDFATNDTALHLMVRGKALPAKIANMPFAPHRYFKPEKFKESA